VIAGLYIYTYPYFFEKRVFKGLYYIPDKSEEEIVDSLIRQGAPLDSYDYIALRYLHSRPEKGWVRVDSFCSANDFLASLQTLDREKTRRVVFYSGDTLEIFFKAFCAQANLDKTRLYRWYRYYSPYKEGGIVAGYYRLPYRLDARAAMAYMTQKSEDIFRKFALKYLGEYNPESFRRYLIIASIIQKESWRREEMKNISAVIYNRLERGMKLQLDATLNYGRYSDKAVSAYRIRHDRSRYNTYRYHGLPPEILGSVTKDALEAAFEKSQKEYLYFVKNIFGRHLFSESYGEHLAKITRLKVERAKLRQYRRIDERTKHQRVRETRTDKHISDGKKAQKGRASKRGERGKREKGRKDSSS
jgi:UPF0755 protein